MNAASDLETLEVAKGYEPTLPTPIKESIGSGSSTRSDDFEHPTEEELATLRRVSGQIPWTAYTVAFVELCERFSYYGTTAVCGQAHFVTEEMYLTTSSRQLHLATSSRGVIDWCGVLWAVWCSGNGSTCLHWPYYFVSLLICAALPNTDVDSNAFWAYIMPLLGAYMADQYWGRMRTIQVSIAIALVGHVILIISAIPAVIVHPTGAITVFTIGIVIMGIGVGGFKSNISPLIAEQCESPAVLGSRR
jgi:proton-dependent oligopeptide transporter, POT family